MKVFIFLTPFTPTLFPMQISFLIVNSQDFYVVPWVTWAGIFLELRNCITTWSVKLSNALLVHPTE